MKVIENYFDYKSKYNKYILLIEVGTFIEVYGINVIIKTDRNVNVKS